MPSWEATEQHNTRLQSALNTATAHGRVTKEITASKLCILSLYEKFNVYNTLSLLLIAVSYFLSLSNVLTYKLSLKKMNFIFQNVQLIT